MFLLPPFTALFVWLGVFFAPFWLSDTNNLRFWGIVLLLTILNVAYYLTRNDVPVAILYGVLAYFCVFALEDFSGRRT